VTKKLHVEEELQMKTISIIKVQKIALTRTLAAYYECCMSPP
jgi:hypothetical protein